MTLKRLTLVCALLVMVSGGCQTLQMAGGGTRKAVTPQEFEEFLTRAEATDPASRGSMAWKFLQQVNWRGGAPLKSDSSLVFLATGEQAMRLTGMVNGWRPEMMDHLAGTNLYYLRYTVPTDSRIEYGITDAYGKHYRDPFNQSAGGASMRGRSVVEMPDYLPSPESMPRQGVPAGRIDTLVIESRFLKYNRIVYVYSPPGVTSQPPNLLLCGDGYAARVAGHLPTQLDNLLAEGRITPTVAAMITTDSERRSWEYGAARGYRQFLASELIPLLRERYGVSEDRDDVAIFGVSLGGLMATDFILHHPELAANLAAFSPAFNTEKTKILTLWQEAPPGNIQVFCSVGYFELGYSSEILQWIEILRNQGTPLVYHVPSDGHSWGHWRGEIAPMLETFFPADTARTTTPQER